MKKTLAIVLALVMVLAMIPAMSADVTEYKTITDKSYKIDYEALTDGGWVVADKASNTVEVKYNWEELEKVATGKWTEDAVMGELKIRGWDDAFATLESKDLTVTVDGKVLSIAKDAAYAREGQCWYYGDQLIIPLELTKAGYSDTFVVQISGTVGTMKVTETAKVTVKCINTAEYKDIKTAVITNVVPADAAKLDAYIVGDKIYMDYVAANADTSVGVTFTFADANKAAFAGTTYAYDATGAFEVTTTNKIAPKDFVEDVDNDSYTAWAGKAVKLYKSGANFLFNGEKASDIQFKLETKADLYETKKYDVVVRTNIAKEDPKGIYFAETTKTIAMGETYAPVVIGVKTGKPVAADILPGAQTDKQVIDIDKDGKVVGTREGVAYITAAYKFYVGVGATGADNDGYKHYVANAQKIVVTLPGESIPELEPAATIYYVTCRNLNVRAGGSTSYKKVDMIHRGDAVKVLEIKNGWAKLADGTYVCAKYIAK